MKWLAGGLTFVNLATVCAVLLGMAAGGLNRQTAILSIFLGLVAAIIAYLGTHEPDARQRRAAVSSGAEPKRSRRKKEPAQHSARRNYTNIWLWLVGACFAIFAFRCFCWLIFLDGNQFKIQSPNNLGDLALHITYIRNFANGVSFWPDNPIYVFSKLRYPVGIDLFNALLRLTGLDLMQGLVWTGLLGSLATFYAFWRWSGAFGVAGFLFNGGLAGFQILWTFKWLDYQGGPSIAWKSIPLTMLVTQRGLLYAIPAGLLLLCHWRAKFFSVAGVADPGPKEDRLQRSGLEQPLLPFWVEYSLYASMPLFHVHTFIALSILLFFIFVFECLPPIEFVIALIQKEGIAGLRSLVSDKARWRDLFGDIRVRKHLAILVASAFLPATFFVWLITDHFQARSILAWKPGWVQNVEDFKRPFFEFWLANFGIMLPLVLLLIALCIWRAWKKDRRFIFDLPSDLAFLIPASAIFIIACLVKTAPWEWDNMKIIIWSYFMVLPFLWKDLIARWPEPVRVGVCLALFGSGFVSLMGGLAAGQPGFGFADREEVNAVDVAVRKFPVEERFAAFPTYNHPLLLNGRKVVLGYPGHLWTQGFDFADTENKLTSLMNGAPHWRETARALRARYIFWGREEKINYGTSTRPWEQTAPRIASGSWGAIYDLEPALGAVSPAH